MVWWGLMARDRVKLFPRFGGLQRQKVGSLSRLPILSPIDAKLGSITPEGLI